jgi:hypothetical protein
MRYAAAISRMAATTTTSSARRIQSSCFDIQLLFGAAHPIPVSITFQSSPCCSDHEVELS